MENMTAFPAYRYTLGKVLASFENLPVWETSRYGEHMLILQTLAGLLLPKFVSIILKLNYLNLYFPRKREKGILVKKVNKL